jgi:DNA polymerase III delta subunit
MICLLSGNFEKRKKTFESLLKRFFEYDINQGAEKDFSFNFLLENIDSNNIFGKKSVFVFNSVLENKENLDFVCKNAKNLEKSENIFIFIESSIKKTDIRPIEKASENIFIFEEPKKEDKKFNIFELTDAFSKRDKKNTWVIYQNALRNGVLEADIVNILIWSIKALILVKNKKGTDSEIKNSGLNPFVFKKSLSNSKLWEEKDLKKALQNLVCLYHDSRRSEDLSNSLELFLIKTL